MQSGPLTAYDTYDNPWRFTNNRSTDLRLVHDDGTFSREDWLLTYQSIENDRAMTTRRILYPLPAGYEKSWVEEGERNLPAGPILCVTAHGVEFDSLYIESCEDYQRFLADHPQASHAYARQLRAARKRGLPGNLIIADAEFPFMAATPAGRVFSYT
jgi:hypothetical protein